MPSVFLTSDTHFGHLGVCKFLCSDGVTKIRPWTDPDQMDEDMVARWNDRVRPTDKVYHLGDVVINRKSLKILDRLNGDKVLIKGNHDIFKLGDYTKYFRDIRSYHVMNGLILSHIPVHPESLYRFGCNIHGHLHQNRVMRVGSDGSPEIDPNYWCACVEHTDFTPILFEDALEAIKEQGGVIGFKSGNYGHGMAT